jgi:hypothetical protein
VRQPGVAAPDSHAHLRSPPGSRHSTLRTASVAAMCRSSAVTRPWTSEHWLIERPATGASPPRVSPLPYSAAPDRSYRVWTMGKITCGERPARPRSGPVRARACEHHTSADSVSMCWLMIRASCARAAVRHTQAAAVPRLRVRASGSTKDAAAGDPNRHSSSGRAARSSAAATRSHFTASSSSGRSGTTPLPPLSFSAGPSAALRRQVPRHRLGSKGAETLRASRRRRLGGRPVPRAR